MRRFAQFLTLFMVAVLSAHAVPAVLNYAGQVAVNGQPFNGQGLFKFALVNVDGNASYWSNDGTSTNGSEPAAHVSISVNGGLYSLLLGNTAMAGMGGIDPQVFAQHGDAKLRVWFSDGVNGFQQLSPDRPFASVPYAFSAGTAQSAGSANIANGSVSLDMLSQDVKSQINAPIGLNRLSAEVTAKLDQNGSGGSGIAVGSIISFPSGQPAPAGYSLYQQGTPKELVWEEKAPVSVARKAFDGVEVLDGKIYFVGGDNSSAKNIAERYDPLNDTWEILSPMSVAMGGVASAVLSGKLYAIGGNDLSSVEIYDPSTNTWSLGPALPHAVNSGCAIVANENLYHIGGWLNNQNFKFVHMLEPNSNSWTRLADMPTARHGLKLVWFDNRIWAVGGYDGLYTDIVESFDPLSNSWRTEASMTTKRNRPFTFVANGEIFVAGGHDGSSSLNSIEAFDPTTNRWKICGNFPSKTYYSDSVELNQKVYVVVGYDSGFSDKVFAADLNASMAGVYDLYRKDGNASAGTPLVQAEVADGSVTASKLDATILKYLKPEITFQPQSQTIYSDSNVSFSVTAEGKYLSYQWKMHGADLTGETNATLNIIDANATLHDGNYSVVVSNNFGSVESGVVEILVNNSTLMNGLVGWWKFDETNGTVAYDSSGNGNDGNLTNGPTWTDGKIGGALSFNNSNSEVNCGNDSSLELSGEITLACWINPNSGAENSKIFGKTDNGQENGYGINWDKDYESMIQGGGVQHMNGGYDWREWGNGSAGFATNTWYHIAYTKKNSIEYAYVNAVLVNQWLVKRNIPTNNADFKIGYSEDAASGFNGLIDDVRIYDRALSAAEVQALYNMGQ